jgi:hypothetical protein
MKGEVVKGKGKKQQKPGNNSRMFSILPLFA